MKCKQCRSVIEKGSLYCRFCGAKQFKSKDEISVPKPKKLADGRYTAQIMIDGVRTSVYGKTEAEYRLNAAALKTGLVEAEKKENRTLRSLMQSYIDANSNILSPSTLRGYTTIVNNRFRNYIDRPVSKIDFQTMVNEEASLHSAKTVKNAWGLVSASLDYASVSFPNINLPTVIHNELPFLSYKQIFVFLDAVKDTEIETVALLALHGLRESELLALTAEDIFDNCIHVNKSVVPDQNNNLVLKNTTKTPLSTRTVPIVIPRLLEILPKTGKLVTVHPSTIRRQLNSVCEKACLPLVGCHGLRRSFASLCYHLGWKEKSVMLCGGWSNMQTVHNFYIKLDQSDVDSDVQNMRDYYNFTTE